jgi:ankyrin repeat protein/tetratricopeptide (TPR) repeat protein
MQSSLVNRRALTFARSVCGIVMLSAFLARSAQSEAADSPGAEALAKFAQTASLRAAVNADDLERVAALLREHPDWVDAVNLEGDTLLHEAATKGYREMAGLLLERGASVIATNQTAHTPLHAAALSGHSDIALLLIAHEAALEALCTRGMSPLFEAIERGHAAAARTLLERGARWEGWNAAGDTALHLAAQGGSLDLVRMLRGRGAALEATNHLGNTPLHAAAIHGHLRVVEWLLQHGAEMLAANTEGETPLEAADRARYPEVARHLRRTWEAAHLHEHDARLSVALLPWHNATGDTNENSWGLTAPRAVAEALARVRKLRLAPFEATDYAYRQLGLQRRDRPSPAQVRRIGEIAEARRVVRGQYTRSHGRWVVDLRVTTTATGKTSRRIRVRGEDWYDVREALTDRLLRALRVTVRPEDRLPWHERATDSSEALACLSRAIEAEISLRPVAETQAWLERARTADPASWTIRLMLAACKGSAGQLAEAERLARSVSAERPDHAEAWQFLGVVELLQGRVPEAERCLRTSLRLSPDESETLVRLAEVHSAQNRTESALFCLLQAARLNPWDAAIRGALAVAFVKGEDPDAARRELREFERLDPDDLNALQVATLAYVGLGDIPRAVKYADRFLLEGRRRGLNPELITGFEPRLAELRQRLLATPVDVARPRPYTTEELTRALAAQLSPAERALVVNPLEDNPALRRWALELTTGMTDSTAKARALFEALSGRFQVQPGYGTRTAQQVFADWLKPEEVFSCQEFAKLYVALARSVGLDAWLVHLERDYQGRPVYHDCAGVFLDGQCYLADPAYRWFGVPHQSLSVLDDLAALAHHLQQHSEDDTSLSRARIGAKLQPDFAWGQIALARALILNDQVEEAELALEKAQRLEPDRWDYFQVKGLLAAHQRRYPDALRELRYSLELNPDAGTTHLILGQVLTQEARWEEARDAFRASLRCPLSPQTAATARQHLAGLDERLAP